MCKSCGCPAEGNTQMKLYVKGFTGNNWVAAVEKALLRLPGVYHVHIHAHDGETIVDYNPTRSSINDIRRTIGELGFTTEL